MKKVVKGLGALALVLVLATGCGSKNNSSKDDTADSCQSGTTQTLNYVNFRDIRDLNPHLYGGEMYAQELLYETLVTINDDGTYAPCLAESWEISEDGKVYTFKIREGVKFSDGEVCDANAIQANFEAILENKERHTWLELIRLLTKAEAIDDQTFQITMSEPYYPMLTELGVTRPFAMISPKAMQDGSTKDGVAEFIGTGPYVLKEFVTDEYALFEANPDYWGEAPKIKSVNVKVIPDNQTRILALENGEIDLIYGKDLIDAEAISKFEDSADFEVALSEPVATRQIIMNTTNSILADISVRKALQYGTNQEEMATGIFNDYEEAAETLFSKTLPYCNVDLKPYTFNVKTAEKLLEEAGWVKDGDIRKKAGEALALNLLYNSNSVTEKTIAEYLKGEYKKIGVDLSITGEEEQSYRDKMKAGQFDLVVNICWGTPYDPQSSLSGMRAPVYGDYAAQQGLADKAEIDRLISEILVSTDETKRQEMYTDVLTRLHEDALYIPITYECNKAIYRKDLTNVNFKISPYEVPIAEMSFK